MAGTRWVQRELLEKNPAARIRVYAVWFAMFPGDDRGDWRPDVLGDLRVIHLWDEEKKAGKFYKEHLNLRDYRAEALWDAYILYDREATWESVPSEPVSWGYTIVGTRDRLAADWPRVLELKAE